MGFSMGFELPASPASTVRISKAELAAPWQAEQWERRSPLAVVFNLSLGSIARSGSAWSLETLEKDLFRKLF